MLLEDALPGYLEALLRLLYPSLCGVCENLLELEERGICSLCWVNFQKFRLSPSEERIRVSLKHADEAWALFHYEGIIKDLLHKIKFDKRRDLLKIFAADILQFLTQRSHFATYDRVVPIPLDFRRRLQREFNQSSLIVREIHKVLRIKRGRYLIKKFSTPAQSLLGRKERRLNVDRVFHVMNPRQVKDKSILLVDDIFTTGATLEEAGKTLKEAGASRVGYFVLARTQGR